MTWVKVCGLRTAADLETAAAAGADAAGLVLVPDTPRFLTVEQARQLAERATIPTVILTRDLTPERLLETWEAVGADGVQPYGEHASEAGRVAQAAGAMVLHPLRVQGRVQLDSFPQGQIPLLDGYHPGVLGGTGTQVPEEWLPPPGSQYILAGGLTPHNVAQAVSRFRPWGVDASSGLESSPGIKDSALIASFVREAKQP